VNSAVNTGRDRLGLGRPTISGRDALFETMRMAHPDAPIRLNRRRRLQLELMAMVIDPATGKPYGKPLTEKQLAVERLRHKTSHQKAVETMGMRWPEDEHPC
jgi:hypothetical protein